MLRRLLFANFKFIYRLSQRARRRFTSNGMLILFIMPVAGVFGFDTRSTLSFQIFAVTLILLITSITCSLFFRGRFKVERILPDYGSVGSPVFYTCTVKNQNNAINRGLVLIDDLKNNFPSTSEFSHYQDPLDKKRNIFDRIVGYPRLVNIVQKLRGGSINPATIDYIAAQGKTNVELELIPSRRGYVYFENIRLAKSDPLGLFHAQKTYDQKDKLLVLPKLVKTPELKLHGKRMYQHGGVNNASQVGDSQEFISLRDYRPGDPMRNIHWRSYAKRGEPIVKEYQDEFFVRYGLILDTYLQDQSNNLFEDAVSIAASFMSAQNNQDALLDLMFIGNNAYRFTSGRGLTGIENILEVLACIEPVYESNIERLQIMLDHHIHECSALVCILLNMNDERKKLLEKIVTYNLPVKVLVLSEEEQIKITNIPESAEIHFIRHDNLQEDLELIT